MDALKRAKQETEEAIQAGNRKYNDMLATTMKTEDQLKAEIDEVCNNRVYMSLSRLMSRCVFPHLA